MIRETVPLDGPDWQVQGFLGRDAGLRAAARPAGDTRPGWLPARVPGSILDDLWRAGEVPDPYVERNSLACEWVPERTWVYRRSIEPLELLPGARALLRFDGLDHAGHVFLDGEPIGRHAGMFVPFEVDVTDGLRPPGPHELSVAIEPAPESEPQVGRTSRVRVHKSRMTYGWDFCPRMVHQGLWQGVSLDLVGAVRIRDVWARPALSADLRRATITVRVALEVRGPAPVRVQAGIDGMAGPTASTTADGGGSLEVELAIDVHDPVLWWPNGTGRPSVHRVTVHAAAEGDEDARSIPLGFRRVELVPNEGGPAGARPYTFVVNGRRTYAKGWNWVPMDALYGVPRPERLRHLLRLAAGAHVNLLRVWGGGLIETPAFYEACDRLGLMVWQEFSQSSSGIESTPAVDDAFVELMAREAEQIVPLRRNHPSLVAWCGGNELEGPDGPLDEAGSSVLAALGGVVGRLDPDRAWLPTSPSGPRFHNRLDVIESDPDGLHDVHGPWEHQGLNDQYRLYDRGISLLNSEFGVEGMTNRRTHEALIAPEHRWPATRANPVYRHLGDWWNNEPLVQAAFGGRLRDLEALRRASHLLQAEGLRYAVEANRRRAWRQSGSVPWQFNESYPNAWCTSAVDHRGDPKPAYHAVARAYAPTVVCAAFDGMAWGTRTPFEAVLWAWTDADPIPAAVVARLVDARGRVLASYEAAAPVGDRPVALGVIRGPDATLPRLFWLDLALRSDDGATSASNRYLFSGAEDLAPLLDLEAASLGAEVAADGDRWCIRLAHDGGPAVVGARLEDARPISTSGWAEVADDGFDLLPGERREIVVRWADAPAAGRRLRLSAWNVPERELAG